MRKRKKIKILLALFSIAIFLPIKIEVDDRPIEFHKFILFLTFLPCLRAYFLNVTRSQGLSGIIATDITIALFSVYASISILINHGSGYAVNASFLILETAGCYLLGRVWIRDKEMFVFVMRVLVSLVILSLPFALYEMFSGVRLISTFFDKLNLMDHIHGSIRRLGLNRSSHTFDHPILLGIVCAMTTSAAMFCAFRKHSMRVLATVAVGFTLATAISSAAIISYFLQLLLAPFGFFALRNAATGQSVGTWGLLVIIVSVFALTFGGLDIVSFVTGVAIHDDSAIYRLDIYYYGLMEVADSPFFGIGYHDWYRGEKMFSRSVDSFWLLTTMRFGVPAFIFMALCFILPLRLLIQPSPTHLRNIIISYTIALVGTMVALGTVHVWNNAYIFVIFFLSSGTFLMSNSSRPGRHNRTERLNSTTRNIRIAQ